MAKLNEETIDKINDEVDFSQAFRMSHLLLGARSFLTDEVARNLDLLAKRLDEVTEGYARDDDDTVFDLADELEGDILEAQELLESIYDVLSSITNCRPDLDEEWEDD